MSVRELIILGTAAQMPRRERNQSGYLLRWDGEAIFSTRAKAPSASSRWLACQPRRSPGSASLTRMATTAWARRSSAAAPPGPGRA